MTTLIPAALLLGALLVSPGLAAADEDTRALEQLIVEMAKTPTDHAVLARYFRVKAERARGQMARHRSLWGFYSAARPTLWVASRRSGKLAAHYAAMAVEYEELARLQDAVARETE
jgi:hypothetical protein